MVIFFQLQNSLTLTFPSSMFKLTKFYVHKYLMLKLKKSCWIYQKRIFLSTSDSHSTHKSTLSSSLTPFPHNPISFFMLSYFLSFGKTHKKINSLHLSKATSILYLKSPLCTKTLSSTSLIPVSNIYHEYHK